MDSTWVAIADRVAPVLGEIAQQVGTTAGQLWDILIRQAVVSGIIDTILIAVLIAWHPYLVKLGGRLIRHAEGKYNDEGWWVLLITMGVVTMVCDIIAFLALSNVLTKLINPEYWALNKVLSVIG